MPEPAFPGLRVRSVLLVMVSLQSLGLAILEFVAEFGVGDERRGTNLATWTWVARGAGGIEETISTLVSNSEDFALWKGAENG